MDNKLNEIRRKIRLLRAEMLGAEDNIRQLVNRDEDCATAAGQLMSMRGVMLGLIRERNRLGGEERLLNVDERLKLDVQAAARKPTNGMPTGFPVRAVTAKAATTKAVTTTARARRER
jgi:hypothetical protein